MYFFVYRSMRVRAHTHAYRHKASYFGYIYIRSVMYVLLILSLEKKQLTADAGKLAGVACILIKQIEIKLVYREREKKLILQYLFFLFQVHNIVVLQEFVYLRVNLCSS